jgi:hypothetical protein
MVHILISEFYCKLPKNLMTNSAIHSVNTRNKNQVRGRVANLLCVQKSAYYAGMKIFNGLPSNLTGLIHRKMQFKVALEIQLFTHYF